FFFYSHVSPHDLHSFPTRRSSDLTAFPNLPPQGFIANFFFMRVWPLSSKRITRPVTAGLRTAVTCSVDYCGLFAREAPSRSTNSRYAPRSEEHTSELQSPCNLVCRLLLDKKKHNRVPSTRMSPCSTPWLPRV